MEVSWAIGDSFPYSVTAWFLLGSQPPRPLISKNPGRDASSVYNLLAGRRAEDWLRSIPENLEDRVCKYLLLILLLPSPQRVGPGGSTGYIQINSHDWGVGWGGGGGGVRRMKDSVGWGMQLDNISCQILSLWLGDIIDSGIGLSHQPASLCSLAGRYDKPMQSSVRD